MASTQVIVGVTSQCVLTLSLCYTLEINVVCYLHLRVFFNGRKRGSHSTGAGGEGRWVEVTQEAGGQSTCGPRRQEECV